MSRHVDIRCFLMNLSKPCEKVILTLKGLRPTGWELLQSWATWDKASRNAPRELIKVRDNQATHGRVPIAWLWSTASATPSSSSSRSSSSTSAPCSKKILEVLIHYSATLICNLHNNSNSVISVLNVYTRVGVWMCVYTLFYFAFIMWLHYRF